MGVFHFAMSSFYYACSCITGFIFYVDFEFHAVILSKNNGPFIISLVNPSKNLQVFLENCFILSNAYRPLLLYFDSSNGNNCHLLSDFHVGFYEKKTH